MLYSSFVKKGKYMKNKINVSSQLWAELDENSLALANNYEMIENILAEFIAQNANDKNLPIFTLLQNLAHEGYQKVCDYNDELLGLFDY